MLIEVGANSSTIIEPPTGKLRCTGDTEVVEINMYTYFTYLGTE